MERIMAIAAQFQKLLASCQEMELSHLRPLVDRMFENADVALLDFAEKAESNMAQSLFFEAMSEVRKKRSSIEQYFYAEVKRSFSDFPVRPDTGKQTTGQEPGFATLALVETDAVETFVATQNAAGKLASRIMERIFALKQRLAVVNSGNAVEENQIPGGPAWLGAAYQQAVEQLELEHKVRLVFIALFDKYVLGRVDGLFDEYNQRLIQAGILPNLRYEVRRQAGGIEIIEKQVNQDEVDQSSDAAAGEQDPDQTPSELGDELFGRICELMSGRRPRPGGGGAGSGNVSPIRGSGGFAGGGGGNPAGGSGGTAGSGSVGGDGNAPSGGGGTLLSQIQSLQSSVHTTSAAMSSDEFIENIEVDQHLIDRLQDTIADERDKIFAGVDRRKLSNADTDVIELVGMMFEYMLKEAQLPNLVKALLSRLHTPLLKVGVIDRSFFTHQGHPARKLLNDMTAAGIRWVEEAHVERGIFPKMKEIVDRVLLDFKEDVSLFDDVVKEFNQAVAELERRASRVEERTNEAASGQEKLQAARARAQEEIRALSQERPIPSAAGDFLQRILADKLTFILLRNQQGDESDEWQAATALTSRVIASVIAPTDNAQREARRQSLKQLQDDIRSATSTLQQADKEKLLHALFELQSQIISGDNATNIVAAPLPQVPAVHDEVDPGELSAEQVRMLEKLKNVPFGTWFEFQESGEASKRAKLSWRSTVTNKFMFVDQMGVKAAVICMRELADGMLNDTVRMVNTEKKPFVDRALSAIHRMLDHAA
jgi:hypothetical protein